MADFNFDDDFQIKPITEGLGFHKKKVNLQEDPMQRIRDMADRPDMLPRSKGQQPVKHFTAAHYPQTEPVKSPPTQKTNVTQPARQAPLGWMPNMPQAELAEPKLIPIEAGFSSILFDTAMVGGLVLIFSAVVFAVTGIIFEDLIGLIQTEATALFACILLVVAVHEIYAVSCRSFFGRTLGEWAFDLQVGTKEQQQSFVYPIQIAFRAFITCITGFIMLPILSVIFGRDIAGMITGVEIYQEQYE